MNPRPEEDTGPQTLPWTRSCFVCGEENPHGLHLKSRMEDGLIVADYVTRDADRGYKHIVHGGIAMTLLDEVMTWAAILAARRVCVAAEMTARMKRPIQVGQTLRVEGEVAEQRSRLVVALGRILDRDGQLLASASGKYVPMVDDQARLCEKDFVQSPASVALGSLLGTDHGPR